MNHNASSEQTRDHIELFSSLVVNLLLKMGSTTLEEELGEGNHKILGIEQVKRDGATSWILHTDKNVEIHENVSVTQNCWANNEMQRFERVTTKYFFQYGYEELYNSNSSSLSLLKTAEIEAVPGYITVIKPNTSGYILTMMDINNEDSINEILGQSIFE